MTNRRRVQLITLLVLLAGLGLAGGLVPARPLAQASEPARAGLIVRFGDGSTSTVCVDLGDDGVATGEEVLRTSELSTITYFEAGQGLLVCKIQEEGCPANDCLCQCRTLDQSCRYWSYYRLGANGWAYSQVGAASSTVRDGMVEGWSWGLGNASGAVAPPPITFADICQVASSPTPTASLTPSATATELPTATASATATPGPPTTTPLPAPTNPGPVIIPVASSTPRPLLTATATVVRSPGPSATAFRATPTLLPSPTPTALPAPEAQPTSVPEVPTEPLPSAVPPPTLPPPPTVVPTETPSATPSPLLPTPSVSYPSPVPVVGAAGGAAPPRAASDGATWLPLVLNAPATATVIAQASVTPLPSDADLQAEPALATDELIWFLALSSGLAVAIVLVRQRRAT